MTIPVGFGQASILFSGNAAPLGAAVTLGFANGGSFTAAAAASAIAQLWATHMLPNQANTITMSGVLVKLGPDDTGPSALSASTVVGGIVGAAVPPNVSVLMSKQTGLGGRKGRGRCYIPGLPEGSVDEAGNMTSGVLGAWQSDATAMLAEATADQHPLYLLHEDATAPTLITALQVQTKVATQRRRLRR